MANEKKCEELRFGRIGEYGIQELKGTRNYDDRRCRKTTQAMVKEKQQQSGKAYIALT